MTYSKISILVLVTLSIGCQMQEKESIFLEFYDLTDSQIEYTLRGARQWQSCGFKFRIDLDNVGEDDRLVTVHAKNLIQYGIDGGANYDEDFVWLDQTLDYWEIAGTSAHEFGHILFYNYRHMQEPDGVMWVYGYGWNVTEADREFEGCF